MKQSRKHAGVWRRVTSVAGVAGALLIACAACCIPMVAPLLAWLSVAGLSLMGPYGMLAAALAALALGWIWLIRRRNRAQCEGGCRINPPA